MQRRIEEERRRKAWATAGYPYACQQAGETTIQTQEATVGLDTLAPVAGVKRKREEEEGAKDSPSKRAKNVEESGVPSPAPATALTPGVAEAQAQRADPLKR